MFVRIIALDLLLLKIVLSNPYTSASLLLKAERRGLHGQPIRAASFHFPPCLSAIETTPGNYSYYGICNDIISWVSEQFRMKLVYVPVNDSDVVKLGIVPVLVQQLMKQEIDVAPFPFVVTPLLLQLIDFSIPLTVEDYHLLQPWPEEESRLSACIRPFSTTVWLFFLISTGVVIVFMSVFTHFRHQQISKTTSFMNAVSDHAIFVMTIVAAQGNYASPKTGFPFRLMLGLWCLTMVVLVNAYTGTLMSYLTVPKLKPIVNTLAELAARRDTQMTVNFELGKARMFLEATSGPNKIIGDSLRKNPQFLTKGNALAALKNILERRATYFTNRSQVKYFMAMDMKIHGKCRMTSSDPVPFIEYYSSGFPKKGRKNWIINHDMQYLKESGLLINWLKKYTPNVDKCMLGKTKPRSRVTSLTPLDLSSAFALLAIGVGLSLLTFLLEIFASYRRTQKIRNEDEVGKNINAKQSIESPVL
ncbi:hypothetical protein GHT06_019336 [Daphnia sinensis]|uniref:Ionotropic glutamate receptor C-terminal domain-containing protein n=1 Tax=Daphnia sinensis TaxID=1820382 RepID=A0AAD5KKL7_9CRUS|nr:hypothetical protein GHT06_019336 [Daphnia sinensis]